MAKKSAAKKSPSVGRQLAGIERLVRAGFRQADKRFRRIDRQFDQVDKRLVQVDKRFEQVDRRFTRADQRFSGIDVELRELRREMNNRYEWVEDSISQLSNHVDGFMKLHETLDIEVARDERADESV
jgi:hypothetical protein